MIVKKVFKKIGVIIISFLFLSCIYAQGATLNLESESFFIEKSHANQSEDRPEDQLVAEESKTVVTSSTSSKEERFDDSSNLDLITDEEAGLGPIERSDDFNEESVLIEEWQDFVVALGNQSITQITLKNNIKIPASISELEEVFDKNQLRTDDDFVYLFVEKNKISRNLIIDGAGHSFDFGNLAIGFTEPSVDESKHWNITLENITILSSNFYAPFFYPKLAESKGIGNNSYLKNSELNFGVNYEHIRYVNNYEELIIAVATISVTEIQFTDDIVAPIGKIDISRKIANINNQVEKFSGWGDSLTNESGQTAFLYFNGKGIASTKVIDGNGYSFDQGSISWCYYNSTMENTEQAWNFTFRNMNSFHGNYWGLLEFWDLN